MAEQRYGYRAGMPVPGEDTDWCPECSGTGEYEEPVPGTDRPLVSACLACNGTGVVSLLPEPKR